MEICKPSPEIQLADVKWNKEIMHGSSNALAIVIKTEYKEVSLEKPFGILRISRKVFEISKERLRNFSIRLFYFFAYLR